MSNDQLLMSLLWITCTIMALLSLASLDCLQQENNTDSPSGEWQASWEGDDNGEFAPLRYLWLCKGGWGQCRTLTRGPGDWGVSLEYFSLYLLFSWPLWSVWRTLYLGQGQSCPMSVRSLALWVFNFSLRNKKDLSLEKYRVNLCCCCLLSGTRRLLRPLWCSDR